MEWFFGYDEVVVASQPYPDVYGIATYTALSAGVYFLITLAFKLFATQWNKSIEDKKKHLRGGRYAGYVCSLVNAIHMSVFSLNKLFISGVADVSGNAFTMCCLLGYLFHDLIESLPEIRKTPSNTGHHLLGIGIVGTLLFSRICHAFIPHMVVMEFSTILLDAMWFFREHGQEANPLYKYTALGFALSFFIVRVLWYPVLVYGIMNYQPGEWMGFPALMRFGLIPALYFLQVYWFVKIVQLALKA